MKKLLTLILALVLCLVPSPLAVATTRTTATAAARLSMRLLRTFSICIRTSPPRPLQVTPV